MTEDARARVAAAGPHVARWARALAAGSLVPGLDLDDLAQDGMLGLIDAAERFDEARGVPFETFAERRVRGAMLDALRRGAWPRTDRRRRREIDAAREKLRKQTGGEPAPADLARHLGMDEAALGRAIDRINVLESTAPLAAAADVERVDLPPALRPPRPPGPDRLCEQAEIARRLRAAVAALPGRERKAVSRYYFGDATLKQIGAEIGVGESRAMQLRDAGLRRLAAAPALRPLDRRSAAPMIAGCASTPSSPSCLPPSSSPSVSPPGRAASTSRPAAC